MDQAPVANAYRVVAMADEANETTAIRKEEMMTVTAIASNVRTFRAVRPEYHHIPETLRLTWTDDFFDDDDEVVAVFDLDYDSMESFYTQVGWATLAGTLCFPQVLACTLLTLAPCFLKNNVRWNVQSQHVAITRDGIRFVRDKRKSCWGLSCTDAGKQSKTVPFDKITDCDIDEPAGNTCICVKNVLATVNVDTASSGPGYRELKIVGLKNPHSFKKLVWAMKRAQTTTINDPRLCVPTALHMLDRKVEPSDDDVSVLLREIRDELRQHNTLLKTTMQPATPSETTVSEIV